MLRPSRQSGAIRPVIVGTIAAVLGAVALFEYLAAFAPTYTDDAFITLQYADTLLRFHCWGFLPGRPANTATSPLNVMLTAITGASAGTVLDAVPWTAATEFGAMFVVLLLLSKKFLDGYVFGVLAFLTLVTNPLLLSTLGLETVLFTLLFLISVLLFLDHRWSWLALSLGLLTLARADGFLFFVICWIAMPVPSAVRAKVAALYALVLLPWHLFSWLYLGSFLPDTLLIKMGQGTWGGVSFSTGLADYYVRRFPAATLSSFALLPFAALAWGRATAPMRTAATLVASYAILHYIGYSILGIPPYHWYYAPLVLGSAVLGALGVTCALKHGTLVQRIVAGVALAVPAAGLAVIVFENGFPPREAPIHSNWATQAEYRAIGLWIRDHVDPKSIISTKGEIGTLAFYSERRLVNYFSDRNEVTPPAAGNIGHLSRIPLAGPLIRGALKLNFCWRRELERLPPPDYTLVLTPGRLARPEGPGVVMIWYASSRWMPAGMTTVLRRTEIP